MGGGCVAAVDEWVEDVWVEDVWLLCLLEPD